MSGYPLAWINQKGVGSGEWERTVIKIPFPACEVDQYVEVAKVRNVAYETLIGAKTERSDTYLFFDHEYPLNIK